MAASSRPVDLGSPAPDFELPDGEGRVHRLRELTGVTGTLVAFICNHCPYVLHMRSELQRYAQDFAQSGVRVIGINPNDPAAYPDETPARITEVARTLPFPYLVDAAQDVARAYDAACTPDLYLYDSAMRLHYHGRFDGSRPNAGVATGEDLRAATWRLLAGQPAGEPQHASVGCSIKWKPGTAPA
jgi:peroxiredoxin